MVERLDCRYDDTSMTRYPDGQFVRYSDYAALEAQLAEAKVENERLTRVTKFWQSQHDVRTRQLGMLDAEATPPAPKVTVKPLDNDYPISEVASWLTNQATRDYTSHEIAALKLAARILAALTAAQESGE